MGKMFLNDKYFITSKGDVYSIDNFVKSSYGRTRIAKGRVIKSFITNSGYKQVNLTSSHLKFYIHRLVAEYFIRKMIKGEEVNHKDGNKLNNNISNLEIVSRSENLKHAYKVIGIKSHNIKLNKKIANEIRKLYKNGLISQKKIGEMYGVSTMVVNRIINNKTKEYENIK